MNPQHDSLIRSRAKSWPWCRAARMTALRVLAQAKAAPTVTVVGKYNHGKSRLLNELMGATSLRWPTGARR
jgi:GTP-binding protein EngB required for normal cell division